MTSKRGSWSEFDLNLIWDNYNSQKVKNVFQLTSDQIENLAEKSFCSICSKPMLRSAYESIQPNSNYTWNVDHINSNPQDDRLENLQPMHPWCNEAKG